MAHVLGRNCKLYRNTGTYGSPTWNEVDNVKDLSLPLEKGEFDVSRRATGGFRATVGTLIDANIEYQMVYDPADADMMAIHAAFLADTAIEFLVIDGAVAPASGVTSQGLRASHAILKFSITENLEEVAMVSVSMKPTYSANAPSWFSVTGS